MQKSLFAVVSIGLIASTLAVNALTQENGSGSHTVIKGDTLWDIAGKYYSNPWLWSKIWQANKDSIKDPHWIYPDQVVTLPEKGQLETAAAPEAPAEEKAQAPAETPAEAPAEAPAPEAAAPAGAGEATEAPAAEEQNVSVEPQEAAEPQEEVAEEPAPEVAVEQPEEEAAEAAPAGSPIFAQEKAVAPVEKTANIEKQYFSGAGMVVPKYWKADGYVVGEKDKKLLISEGDTLYINLGAYRVRPGTQCMLYRKIDELTDPETDNFLGYEVRKIGKIEITKDVSNDASTAKVLISYEPIEIGDLVKIIEPPKPEAK